MINIYITRNKTQNRRNIDNGYELPYDNWINDLARNGVIKPNSSLFELGPQDIGTSREVIQKLAAEKGRLDLVETIMEGDPSQSVRQKAFYELFGVSSYKSSDPIDKRADFDFDFNYPIAHNEKYDIITNFGTAEHICNVVQLFASVHKILHCGGIALHVLPSYGDINHGFYNFHPIFFVKIAEANDYVIEDYSYIDNIENRTKNQEKNLDMTPYRHPEIIGDNLSSYDACGIIRGSFGERKLETSAASDRGIFDYSFVALRKLRDEPFKIPSQYKIEKPASNAQASNKNILSKIATAFKAPDFI